MTIQNLKSINKVVILNSVQNPLCLNPKSEYRNSKQYLNPNFPNIKLFVICDLLFRICLVFIISNLEFTCWDPEINSG